MICYRDMTFCEFKECKHFNNGCHRSLTDKVKEKAKEWWNTYGILDETEPPICMFAEKPDCFEKKESEKI